jgi:hypothetical protein
MCVVNDGYINGATAPRQKNCGVCGQRTLCIDIAGVVMPRGVTTRATILHANRHDRDDPAIVPCIGVGCGCYGKLHRQLAHINKSRVEAGAVV